MHQVAALVPALASVGATQSASSQDPLLNLSSCSSTSAHVVVCLPKEFLVLCFTYWQKWAFVFCAKKETVAIKILINEHTEQILLSKAILPLLPRLSQACITSRNPGSLWYSKCQDQESRGFYSGTTKWEEKVHLERTTAGDVNPYYSLW